MNKDRKLTDVIFKFTCKDTYRCAMLNLNECLSKNVCSQEKCDRYKFCAGNNLTHINLYVEKLETALNEIRKYVDDNKNLNWYVESCHFDDILQIIDKVGGNDEEN